MNHSANKAPQSLHDTPLSPISPDRRSSVVIPSQTNLVPHTPNITIPNPNPPYQHHCNLQQTTRPRILTYYDTPLSHISYPAHPANKVLRRPPAIGIEDLHLHMYTTETRSCYPYRKPAMPWTRLVYNIQR